MNKNKKNFFTQQMYESFINLCVSNDAPLQLHLQETYAKEINNISYEDAIDSYFESGFNINHYWYDENKYSFPISMIEELTIYASNAKALFIIYPNIEKEFFISMPYKEHKSLVTNLISKVFFSSGEKEYLLDILFSKGLKIIQEKEESIEIDWIESGEIDCIHLLFSTQKDFNFDFKYNFRDKSMDFTSIVELIIRETKSENSSDGYLPMQAKLKNLDNILTAANSLIIFQEIGEQIQTTNDTIINNSDNIFKI